MMRKTMLALGMAATVITGMAIATSDTARARTDVHIGFGVNVVVPGDPYDPPVYDPVYDPVPYTPVYWRHVHRRSCGTRPDHPGYWRVRHFERPRWRTRCHRHVRRVRVWSYRHGHWHVKRIRTRHCHRVRVW